MRRVRYNSGFTLVEVLVAVLLVGVAIAALIAASGSFTRINAAGIELSTADFLIEQIRERSTLMSYISLGGLDGPHNPPIDADGQPLIDFSAWSQSVTVENVSNSNFEQVEADPSNSDFIRITVTVSLNNKDISSASWIRANY